MYRTELRSMGIGYGWRPRRFIAGMRISLSSLLYSNAGMGKSFLRGGAYGFSRWSPDTPTSYSACS